MYTCIIIYIDIFPVLICPPLPDIGNALVNSTTNDTTYLATATIQCDTGYTINNNSRVVQEELVIQCSAGKEWQIVGDIGTSSSAVPESCQGKCCICGSPWSFLIG